MGTGPTSSDRWSRVVNLAILTTLAILLFRPSGVVTRWVVAEYGEWREQRRIARTWDDLVSASSHLGPPPAPGRTVIVEFLDYDCPACQTVAADVLEATRHQDLTVVIRHVPSARKGSVATEAALAAICAERYDRFPRAHSALISDQAWLSTPDWIRFGLELGVGDSLSFVHCMGEDGTKRRLAQDMALAESLEIRGTPTFVSIESLHRGAPGLRQALASASRAAATQDRRPLRPMGESILDSSDHPDLSELLELTAGFFVSDTGLALVDRTEIHLVGLVSGETRVVGREGEGPDEFGRITRAVRTPQGIAVWDILRHRLTFIGREGEILQSRRYLDVPFQDFMNVRPVAVGPDGSVAFRDGTGKKPRGYQGRTWHPVKYVAVPSEGDFRVVTEAQGDEMFYGKGASARVIFGNRTLEAATGDRFIVAETNRKVIVVFDWSGREVASIPMIAGVKPSADQVRTAWESKASSWRGTAQKVRELAALGKVPGPKTPEEFENFLTLEPDWPTNEVAPPIDAVLTDMESRLWVRDYRLPDQDSVTWRVWDIDSARLLFTARIDGGDTLLDAQGDLVLLRRLDVFDVPRAVVIRLGTGSAPGVASQGGQMTPGG